jgi:hypothetical protein
MMQYFFFHDSYCSISLLGFLSIAWEEDQLALVDLQASSVQLQWFYRLVATTVVNSNTNCWGETLRDLCSLQQKIKLNCNMKNNQNFKNDMKSSEIDVHCVESVWCLFSSSAETRVGQFRVFVSCTFNTSMLYFIFNVLPSIPPSWILFQHEHECCTGKLGTWRWASMKSWGEETHDEPWKHGVRASSSCELAINIKPNTIV